MTETGSHELLWPSDPGELRSTLADLCARRNPFLPVGCCGRLGWGAASSSRTLVSTASLNRIRRLDAEDLTCGVEPGLPLGDFLAAVEERGLAFEPGPFFSAGRGLAEGRSRSIGGLLGEAAPSPRGFDRGSLRSQVLGIRAIDGKGREFQAGARVVKNVAGYDLGKLFVGAGGAFFTVIEIQLRLITRPAAQLLLGSPELPFGEAVELWRGARLRLHEARSIDLVFTGEACRVEASFAGPPAALSANRQQPGFRVVAEGEELWDEHPVGMQETRYDPGHAVLRGRLRPSRLPELGLPAGSAGRIHRQGAFELQAGDFGAARFPGDAIVRALRHPEKAADVPGDPAAPLRLLGRRLRQAFGDIVGPGRLSFDTGASA
ncbi:MAG: FAD-binding oxidoreductase [Planctomycetota bacterium]